MQGMGLQALQREQMRTADRAMSNIESHPEGFNALRRMYENIQVALLLVRPCSVAAGWACADNIATSRSRS